MKKKTSAPIKIAIEVIKAHTKVEPETAEFEKQLKAQMKKAGEPVFMKKLQSMKDEYFGVVVRNEAAFAEERVNLERKHAAVRFKNEKEFNEKVQVLKRAYGFDD